MYESKKLNKQQIIDEELHKQQPVKKTIGNSNADFFREDSQTCGEKMKRKINQLTDKAANFLECTRLFSVEKLDQLRNQSPHQQLQHQSPHTIKSEFSYGEENNSKIDTKAGTKDGASQKYKAPPEDLEELPIKNYSLNQPLKFTKRYAQTYEQSYSDRKRKFGYTYEYIQKERLKQYQRKQKTCWGELKRLLFCRGGNYLEDLDEKQVQTAVSETRSIANKKSREPSLSNNKHRSENVFYQETKQQNEDLEEIKLDRSGNNNKKFNQNLQASKQGQVKVRKQFQTKNEHLYEHRVIEQQILRQNVNKNLGNQYSNNMTDSHNHKPAQQQTEKGYKQGIRNARKKTRNASLVRQKVQTQPSMNTYNSNQNMGHNKKVVDNMQIIHRKTQQQQQQQQIPQYQLQKQKNTATFYNPNTNTNMERRQYQQDQFQNMVVQQNNAGRNNAQYNNINNDSNNNNYNINSSEQVYGVDNNNNDQVYQQPIYANTNTNNNPNTNTNMNNPQYDSNINQRYASNVDNTDGDNIVDNYANNGYVDTHQYNTYTNNNNYNDNYNNQQYQGNEQPYNQYNNSNNNNQNDKQNNIYFQDEQVDEHVYNNNNNQQQQYQHNQYDQQYHNNQYDPNQYNNIQEYNQQQQQHNQQYNNNNNNYNQYNHNNNNNNMAVTRSYDQQHSTNPNEYDQYQNKRYSVQEPNDYATDNNTQMSTQLKRKKKQRKPTNIKVNQQEAPSHDIVLDVNEEELSNSITMQPTENSLKPEMAKKKKNRRQPNLVIIKEKDDHEVMDLEEL